MENNPSYPAEFSNKFIEIDITVCSKEILMHANSEYSSALEINQHIESTTIEPMQISEWFSYNIKDISSL